MLYNEAIFQAGAKQYGIWDHMYTQKQTLAILCYMKITEQTLSFREGLASKPDLDAIKVLCQLRVWSIDFCSECNWKCGSKQPIKWNMESISVIDVSRESHHNSLICWKS